MSNLFPRIFDQLARREGQEVTLPTLVSLTGLSETQIQGSIANARRNNPDHARRVKVVQQGRVWKFINVADANGDDTIEKVVEAVEMGAPHIWRNVLKVLTDAPGEVLSKEEIVKRLAVNGITMSTAQVTAAMNTILRKPSIAPEIEVVWRSHSWKFKPNKSTKNETSGSIRGSVLRYFTQLPGQILHLKDIASDLGFSEKQVQNAMYNLLNDENSLVRPDFEIIQSGRAWRYTPNKPKPAPAQPAPVEFSAPNGQVTPKPARVPATSYPVPVPVPVHAAPQPSAPVATPVAVPAVTSEPVPVKTGGRLFEQVGELADGALLLKDDDSKFYSANPL